MGLTCEGYGLRLKWVQYNPHDTVGVDLDYETTYPLGTRVSRSSLSALGVFANLQAQSSPELDATIATLDDWRPVQSSKLEYGAFCVFSVQSSRSRESQVDTPSLDPSILLRGATATPDRYDISGIQTPFQETGSVLDASVQASDDSHEHLPPTAYIQEQERPAPQRHLDALLVPSKQKRLIHHWITFTSRKIVLIDEPHNPCRTMMLPMALKGLVSAAEASNADVAIFHALCASAAYNLFELSGRVNEQDRVLALYHDHQAVHHLRDNLNRAGEHRDQSFAMAIMACIAVEAVSGTTQRWRTHVSGGLAYLDQLQSQGLPEVALSAFRQHMVKMAILCGLRVQDHLKAFLHDDSAASDRLELTFPYYGVSRSFLRNHDRINDLVTQASPTRTPEQEKDLDVFELQLYLDYPSLPLQPQGPGATNAANSIVIHHTSMAFYYAELVFFQRSVRQSPMAAVQDLVALGLYELESIDRVGQGTVGCLMLWPVLVLGAECSGLETQGRMRDWFRAQRQLGFRNLVVLEDLVTTVWRTRTDSSVNKSDADWQHVISQPQFDVFRL